MPTSLKTSWLRKSAVITGTTVTVTNNEYTRLTQVNSVDLEDDSYVVIPETTTSGSNYTVWVIGVTALGVATYIIPYETLVNTLTQPVTITAAMRATYSSFYFVVGTDDDATDIPDTFTIYTSEWFFNKSDIYQWITPKQLDQFTSQYPKCINSAYERVVGLINAQIGNYADVEELLAVADPDEKNTTLLWIVIVLTTYNICAPSLNISEPLKANRDLAMTTLRELKGGQTSMVDAPLKEENNAVGMVINQSRKYRG